MFSKILLDLLGYKVDETLIEGFSKQRICIFPHTSYFESMIVILAISAYDLRDNVCFACAHEYIDSWITGWLLKYFGGFAVKKGNNTTESIISFLKANPNKILAISPEGSLESKEWKNGFFYIAQSTGAPVVVWGVDFSTHIIRAIPGDYYISKRDKPEDVIPKIKKIFSKSGIAPLYPENSNPKIILQKGTQTSMLPLRGRIFVFVTVISLISLSIRCFRQILL